MARAERQPRRTAARARRGMLYIERLYNLGLPTNGRIRLPRDVEIGPLNAVLLGEPAGYSKDEIARATKLLHKVCRRTGTKRGRPRTKDPEITKQVRAVQHAIERAGIARSREKRIWWVADAVQRAAWRLGGHVPTKDAQAFATHVDDEVDWSRTQLEALLRHARDSAKSDRILGPPEDLVRR